MFIDFGFGDTEQVILEIYLGNQLIQKQQLNAPLEILKMQFMGLVQDIAQNNKPMKCKIIKYDIIWDQYEKEQKIIENYIEFRNKAMED